jgi:CBS domain-containing protein
MQEYAPLSAVLIGQLLVEFKDKDLFKLVTLKHDDQLEVALRKLGGFKFLSAPVETPEGLKMVDLMDIATAVLLRDYSQQSLSLPLSKVCNLSLSNEIKRMTQAMNLLDVVKHLASGNHRLLVVDDDKPIGLISQRDMCKWLAKHPDNIPPPLRNLAAKQLMIDPLCVKESDPALSAVDKCVKHHYSGVAVVDDKGTLNANFSLSDLRTLVPENFDNLLKMSVIKYLKEMHISIKEPVVVTEETPFPTLVKLVHQNHIHRLYVVDKEFKPKGVISLSSLMDCLYKYAEASM